MLACHRGCASLYCAIELIVELRCDERYKLAGRGLITRPAIKSSIQSGANVIHVEHVEHAVPTDFVPPRFLAAMRDAELWVCKFETDTWTLRALYSALEQLPGHHCSALSSQL